MESINDRLAGGPGEDFAPLSDDWESDLETIDAQLKQGEGERGDEDG